MAANKRKIFNVILIATAFAAADEEEQRKMKISYVWNIPDLGRYL